MRIADAQWIPASLHQTWDALNDASVLRQCIPGCVKTSAMSATEFGFTVHASVGGLETDYDGELLVSDVNAPHSCTLAFEGKGKATGLVIGTAQINLSEKDGGTRFAYTLALQTGGRLAQLGEETVRKGAEQLIRGFFANFIDHAASLPRLPPPPEPEVPVKGWIHSAWSWLAFLGVIAVLFLYHYFYK